MHHYFAGHGYAAVRIDVRGAGDSDGVLTDEYSEAELTDGVAAIAWIAAQPWCSGAVGMIGKSWGGFNALQLAARRPPALRAIITVCGSDDRYADDAHYMGGFLQEALRWWDRWLKGIDTGVLDEPLLRVWMQERGEGDGRWVAETAWPSPRITPTSYALDPGRLVETAGPETRLEWRSPQSVGLAAGDWCAFAADDGPTDQRDDDAGSLIFDSAPLGERLEIL